MIICITGYCEDLEGNRRIASAGKDTAAARLVERHGFVRIGLADPLKRFCQEVFEFSDEQMWGGSQHREAPDPRYLRPERYVYPEAPPGALWLPIGGERYTLISEHDLLVVASRKWCVNEKEPGKKTSYVRETTTSMKLHQLLMGTPPAGQVIDHINGDGMDNRRENLRFCTHAENHANEGKRRGGTSAFKGVSFDSARNRWSAKLMVNGETINLGRFELETDAAMAYDRAALEIFGEHARTNSSMFLTPRHALQQLGTQWGRACYDNVWIEYGLRIAKRLEQGGVYYDMRTGLRGFASTMEQHGMGPKTHAVFSDIRFFNEYEAMKAAGAKLVRVRRKMNLVFSDEMLRGNEHASETQLSSFDDDDQFDYVLDNSGTIGDLALQVDAMMEKEKRAVG